MKKLIIGVSLSCLLMACEPEPAKNTDVSSINSERIIRELYAYRPTHYTWPVAGETAQVSTSLLAENYYLVIDGSGSMDEIGCSGVRRKMDVAKEAVSQFIDKIPKDANVGLLVFDDRGIGQRVPLGLHHTEVKQEIQQIRANGGTPLLGAMRIAYSAMTKQAQEQLGYGGYHMVVVTDGEANSGQDPSELVDKLLQESPITLHTIGFCIGDGHSLNRPEKIDYRAANNPAELQAGLQSVLAESVDYAPTQFEKAGVAP